MIRLLAVSALLALPVHTMAATKHLECSQTTDKGVDQKLYVTLDDNSTKAEVELFALSAECAGNRSCGTKVYDKEVLPSSIRLTNILRSGGLAMYTSLIDIDRTSLAVVTQTKLNISGKSSETLARGQCSMRVDNAPKVL